VHINHRIIGIVRIVVVGAQPTLREIRWRVTGTGFVTFTILSVGHFMYVDVVGVQENCMQGHLFIEAALIWYVVVATHLKLTSGNQYHSLDRRRFRCEHVGSQGKIYVSF